MHFPIILGPCIYLFITKLSKQSTSYQPISNGRVCLSETKEWTGVQKYCPVNGKFVLTYIPSMTDWPHDVTSTSLKMSTIVTSQSLNYQIVRTVLAWYFDSSDTLSVNSVIIKWNFLNVSVKNEREKFWQTHPVKTNQMFPLSF